MGTTLTNWMVYPLRQSEASAFLKNKKAQGRLPHSEVYVAACGCGFPKGGRVRAEDHRGERKVRRVQVSLLAHYCQRRSGELHMTVIQKGTNERPN